MKFKTTIPLAPPDARPEAGARKMSGKSSLPEAVLLGNDPGERPSTAVKEAPEVVGKARKCIDVQVQGDGGSNSPNGNPKKRSRAWWGVDEPKT